MAGIGSSLPAQEQRSVDVRDSLLIGERAKRPQDPFGGVCCCEGIAEAREYSR